jgi:hypothetical protein
LKLFEFDLKSIEKIKRKGPRNSKEKHILAQPAQSRARLRERARPSCNTPGVTGTKT